MVELARSPDREIENKKKLKIAAAIPCYNTQTHIADVISKTKRYVDEVIVIDDGSIDMTVYVAEAAGARVISHKKNCGKGAAMKTAFEYIDSDIIVFIDGDGQHDPGDIPHLIEPIIQGKADFVIGSRYLSQSKVLANPFTRKFSNFIASTVISVVITVLQPISRFINHKPLPNKTGTKKQTSQASENYVPKDINYRLLNGKIKWITDCTSGLTAMRKENWSKLDLVSNGYQIETEMIFEQAKNGYIIAETPISCTWEDSLSKLSVIKDGLITLRLLLFKIVNYY